VSSRRPIPVAEVEQCLERVFVAAEGARLRAEDRRKAIEVTAMLGEISRALARTSRSRAITLVDAAAGKAYVGLLAAALVVPRAERRARVVAIEREPQRAAAASAAASLLGVTLECVVGDVADPALWPEEPTVTVALHACGPAADAVLDRAVAARTRCLLLVPCCTSGRVSAAAMAAGVAARLCIPRHAPVRRRFLQALIDAERTLRLEAAGYETEVVELCPPTVTPHNLLWRARRVGEPARVRAAVRALACLRDAGAHAG
jgi:hypothetical protein